MAKKPNRRLKGSFKCIASRSPRNQVVKSTFPEYTRRTRSIPSLLMPWFLVSPGNQQPSYYLCKIIEDFSTDFSSMRKESTTKCTFSMMTPSNGNIFHVTGPLHREFTGHPVNSTHKGQWHGALMFSLICAWINSWVNNRKAADLRCHRAHYDVIVMSTLWNDKNANISYITGPVMPYGDIDIGQHTYHQATRYHWISADQLSIATFRTNFNEILIKIR